MKLLWIDDEIDMLRPFIYTLKEKGYEVETATNGPDGLELLREKDFDLVLLDQIMSGMDGLETLRRIKEAQPNIFVTMVTKSDKEILVDEAYGEMVDDFLIKPFTPAQLLAVLKRLLGKRKLVVERIGKQYMAAMSEDRDRESWQGWVDYYRSLNHWQAVLGHYGDEALQEVQLDRWRQANEDFCRFVTMGYKQWLRGEGPVMSHRIIEEYVRPHWEEKPVYFILFDAMRADQWDVILPLLRDYYEVETAYYCSALPTATPYARNAIFSGLLPLEIVRRYPRYWVFTESGQNRYEKELLTEQLHRLRFKGRSAFFKVSSGEELGRMRGALLDKEVRFTAVVLNFLDQLIHSIKSTKVLDEIIPNDAALVGTTKVWFSSSWIFEMLKTLARRDCRVVITSDHGFIRVRRPTLIYGGREISANLRYKHGAALRTDERKAILLKHPEDFMLPVEHASSRFAIAKSDYYFIYPTKPRQYERTYKYTYQHGGVTLNEMIISLAILKPR
ncbi:hypothetical protein CH330_04165 [candidate division WOR-3 bacterium JGI_Cruoil_03_51_56]|uniref:Response regulatory domain-containing protein n=1 Tax=candidate division WOR-3 bacterium JGI_Cruoil_03_51_56 TaxID=1973747 RepID=A0A235BUQ1_UNCW3|nr:MAG: hypothetical protein CH330_04165 [candidate division WOR-3 bacterium JGI_Cruoil_03_51_56]